MATIETLVYRVKKWKVLRRQLEGRARMATAWGLAQAYIRRKQKNILANVNAAPICEQSLVWNDLFRYDHGNMRLNTYSKGLYFIFRNIDR